MNIISAVTAEIRAVTAPETSMVFPASDTAVTELISINCNQYLNNYSDVLTEHFILL